MYELQVDGMTCGGCAASVKRAIQAVDGAAEVNVNLEAKTVSVNTSADMNVVKSAVMEAGYPVITCNEEASR